MTTEHCPGFENNKSLAEITLTCPDCGKNIEIFSDEMDKKHTCPACKSQIDPKSCAVNG